MQAELDRIKLLLKLEQFKTSILAHFLKERAGLNLSDIIQEKDDGIHIFQINPDTVSVFVHSDATEPKKIPRETSSDLLKFQLSAKEQKKTVYKSVQEKKLIKPIKPIKTIKPIKPIKSKITEEEKASAHSVEENDEKNMHEPHELHDMLETLFSSLDSATGRMYKKTLVKIRNTRIKLLKFMILSEYIILLTKHVKKIEIILQQKKYDKKKMDLFVECAVSPLELRLISHGQYYNNILEADEIQKLGECLKFTISQFCPKKYVTFSYLELWEKVCNYGIALFPIKETLKRYIIHPHGFSNIVYLALKQQKKTPDPYTFYSLTDIKADGTRCWKMEIRLDEFGRTVIGHLISYCVKIFRKIYMDIFNDNIYRETYLSIPICQQDCEQLLVNIIFLSKPKQTIKIMQNIVMKHNTFFPTTNDKFNLTGDDRMQRRQFAEEQDSQAEVERNVRRLFDEISEENVKILAER